MTWHPAAAWRLEATNTVDSHLPLDLRPPLAC